MDIIVRPDPAAVAQTACDLVSSGLKDGGPVTLGLAGGGTPAATYALLARADVSWERATLWLGDERWVPADNEDSNAAMARDTLGRAADRLVAPDYAIGDPRKAAEAYEESLRRIFAPGGGVPDTVLLGIGDDGHTASLLPGTAALAVEDRLYVANFVASLGAWRLTATLPLLASARRLLFLVTGRRKAGVVAEIIEGGADHPAGVAARRAQSVVWVLDAEAASSLRETRGEPAGS
jgi:6-phosphogluconolactonase